jgi:hypothetical protein
MTRSRLIMAVLIGVMSGAGGCSDTASSGGRRPDAGSGTDGGGTGGTGGTGGGTGGTSMEPRESGTREAGARGGSQTACGALDSGQPEGSPPFAACYGCHASNDEPPGRHSDASTPQCKGFMDYEPGDLPCGACTDEGSQCRMGVKAYCDCDGPGPRQPFVDPNFVDSWLCACTGGAWSCWFETISGSSCGACYMDAGMSDGG